MNQHSKKYSIEKFNGTSFHLWKFEITAILEEKGLMEIVNGTEALPDNAAAAADKEKYKLRVAKAFSIICLSLDRQQMALVVTTKHPKEAWDKLVAQFEGNTRTNKVFLHRQIMELRMHEGDDMSQHLEKLLHLAQQLEGLRAPVGDLVTVILVSLPQSYSSFVTAVEQLNDAITPEELKTKLLNEEAKRRDSGHRTDTAFYSTAPNPRQKNNNNNNNKKNVTCHYCGKRGHVLNECRKRIADLARSQNTTNSTAKNNNNNNNYNNRNDLQANNGKKHQLLMMKMNTKSDDSWLIDSGASVHLCKSADWFTDYKATPKVSIRLGDNRLVDAVGQGSINLILDTGSGTTTTATLTDVLYVPHLAHNFFSVACATKHQTQTIFCW
jgi:gag-polypeptide of LTR copia-type